MKLLVSLLPEKRFYTYQGRSQTVANHVWVDLRSQQVRIVSPYPDPWSESDLVVAFLPNRTKGKNNRRTITGLTLRIQKEVDGEVLIPATIERTTIAARCGLALSPNLVHFGIKFFEGNDDKAQLWLEYNVYPDFKHFDEVHYPLFLELFGSKQKDGESRQFNRQQLSARSS